MKTAYQTMWTDEVTSCPTGITARNWSIFGRHVHDGETLRSIALEQHSTPVKIDGALRGVHRALKAVQSAQGTGLEVVPYRLIPELLGAGYRNAEQVSRALDGELLTVSSVGPSALKRIREAIPMAGELVDGHGFAPAEGSLGRGLQHGAQRA